ncbi:hypothetical protein [Clostridium perfringens]|uniref:hypothetical protein n=1 Tax=Clostridium perfringens TaxID=1502 RepID=UPI001F05CB40|nr:hypothetical protein [Clostridium perfringens]
MDISTIIKMAPLITALLGIITILGTYFNKEYDNYREFENDYFNELLRKYMIAYRKNKNINAIKYIRKNHNYSDVYIPSYINYLIEAKNKEDLHKVLIVDYFEGINSEENIFRKTFHKILNLGKVLVLLFMVGFIFFTMSKISIKILDVIKTYDLSNIKLFLSELLIAAIIFFLIILICAIYTVVVGLIFTKSIKKEDKYINELKYIKKQINIKVEKYDTNSDYWYIH